MYMPWFADHTEVSVLAPISRIQYLCFRLEIQYKILMLGICIWVFK